MTDSFSLGIVNGLVENDRDRKYLCASVWIMCVCAEWGGRGGKGGSKQ